MSGLKPFDGVLDDPTALKSFDGPLDGEAPKPRGALAEIANQGYAGVVSDLPKMVGQAAQYVSDPGKSVYEWGKGVADAAEKRGQSPGLQPDEKNHNVVTNALASGARMIPSSIAPAALVGGAIAAAPFEIPAAAVVGAGALLGSIPAALSQGQQTLDKAKAAGVPDAEAIPAARKTALIEGAGETIGTIAGAKLLGLGGHAISTSVNRALGRTGGTAAGNALEDATSRAVLKPWAKQIPESVIGEVGTEMGQNAGESYVEQQAGIDKQSPWDSAKEAIAPTLGMTALMAPFGLVGHSVRAKAIGRRADILSAGDADPEQRMQAATQIQKQLAESDPKAAENFGLHAAQAIDGKQPLELGEHLFAAPEIAPPAAPPAANLSLDPQTQLSTVQSEESVGPDVPQAQAPDGRAVLNAQQEKQRLQREAELAANRAVTGPDDEIFSSTGFTARAAQPVKPSEAMGLDPAAGPLSAAAVTAVDTGAHQVAFDTSAAMATYRAETESLRQQQDAQDAAELEQAQRAEQEQAQAKTQADTRAMLDRATAPVDLTADELFPKPEKPDQPGSFIAKAKEAKTRANNPTNSVGGSSTTQAPAETIAKNTQNQALAPVEQAQAATNSVATGFDAWRSEFEKAKVNNDHAAVQSLYDKVRVSLNGPAQAHSDVAVKQFEKLKSDIEQYAATSTPAASTQSAPLGVNPVTQPAQPVTGEGVNGLAAENKVGRKDSAQIAQPENVLPEQVDQKRAKAIERIAKGTAYFSSGIKAQQFIAQNGLKETHTVQRHASSASRHDVVAKPVVKESLTTQPVSQPQGNTSVNQTPVAIETTPQGSQAPKPAAEVAPAQPAEHIGRDNRPLSEGGKPFKTKDAATEAKKLQPMLRVVKSGKGFALAPKTDKQLAAEAKAAKRLGNPQTSPRGEPIPAHAFIASEGGMHRSTKSDMNIGINPRVGNRNLFAGKDKGLSMERATARLVEEGYLKEGASHSDAAALIKRSLTTPQYTATGTETAAQTAIDAKFDDYLASQEDAAQNEGFDPFKSMVEDGFNPFDIDMTGYDELQDPIKLEVNALLAQAGALGIDTSNLTEQAYEDTRNGSEQDYYDAARSALTAAIETGNRSSLQDSGTPGNAREQAGLAAPSRADILAQQERTDNAPALDDKAQIDAEASRQTLTQQTAPEQRKDTSGDMFAMEKAKAEIDQRNAGVQAAKDPNQSGMFDEPAPDAAPQSKTPSAAELRAQADLQAALADLGDIFGNNTRLNMMPEQEAKILPVMVKLFDAAFRLGYIKFKDAAKFAIDKIRAALGNDVADGITLEHLQGAYVSMSSGKTGVDGIRAVGNIESKSEIESHTAQTDNERNGESNAASTNNRVERNRQEPATQPAVGNPVPAGPAATDPATAETGGRSTGSSRSGQQDRAGVPFGSAPVTGERGDQRLRGGVAEPELESIIAGADFGEPGGDSGIAGIPPEPIAASQVATTADQGAAGLKAGIERARADRAPVKLGDIESIRATLPQLLPGQQDDVLIAEKRFADPKGYGMLFTNGTGTGKTFTGLGAIKRNALQGKDNTLIVAPDDKIASDWIESGKLLGLDISKLADTKDAGKGIVITTYANLGENDALATRQWDMVVADEAHSLMQAADGKPTGYLQAVRALTYHPDGAQTRHDMLNRDKLNRSSELRAQIVANNAIINNPDTMDVMVRSLGSENTKLHAEEVKLNAELHASMDAMKAEVADKQGADRPRLVALSATPFAYEKTIDWANGYLFEYTDGYPYDTNDAGLKYNLPDPREYYFQTRFGYTMRYNKLTQPDGKIDSGMLQRQWNGELKKTGALSGRMLDVVPDYDRRFVLVDSAIGNRIDEALGWLTEQRLAAAKGDGGFGMLSEVINDKFKYLEKRYLLEAIKATEVIPIVKQHMAMGRKVVVFHDYKKGGGFNPFRIAPGTPAKASADNVATVKSFNAAVSAFNDKFSDLVNSPLGSMPSPIDVFSREIPEVMLINGDQKAKDLLARYKSFQDDSTGPQVMLVQSAKNKGWSGHDTTGKHQRVLINLGQPTAPTLAIQQEGRIYRTGQASDAIMRYLNTGTNWERWTFASTIASRASTAENLGMGEMARALKDSFIQSFEESDAYPPGHEQEGKGGKERDKAANNAVTEFDRAKTHYWATQKKNSRTKAQEGADYFATPEPLGLKMVQWLDARSGEDLLEPSGGHGSIARWFPEKTNKTVIEPSLSLRSRLAMVMNVAEDRIIDGTFEDHAVVNKYDGIAMNPPFGTAGRTAVDHIAKAATHLRDGGRIVALLPTGPAADKKFSQWFYESSEKAAKPLGISHAHGPIYKGDTVMMGGFGQSQSFVVEHVDGPVTGPNYVRAKGIPKDGGINVIAIDGITPGKRTETINPAAGLKLVATIKLPQVTFERAGTGVATRVVVIEKSDRNVMQLDRDLSDITNINELFDRLENMDFPARPKVDAVEAEVPAKVEKPARERKQTAPQAEVGDSITLGGKSYPVSTYTTNAGKELRGVWAASKAEALQYGPSTFEKKGLGFFVRERDFPKVYAPDAPALSHQRPAFSRGAQAQATQSVEKLVDAIKSKWENAPEIVVAFDMQDDRIPERVRQEDLKQRSGGAAGTPEGFYYAGKVYLMSSQLATPNDVARVLFHEAAHAGMRGFFGSELKPILQQIVTMRRKEVEKKLKEYGLRGISDIDKLTAAEEVLAEMAQSQPTIGFVKRAIAIIRTWLRKNVPGLSILNLSDGEIVNNFIIPARDFIARGHNEKANKSNPVTFSRGFSEEEKSTAMQRYVDGEKVLDIAADMGIGNIAIYEWLKDAGIATRIPVKKLSDKNRAEAIQMYIDGRSTPQISAEFGVHSSTINTYLKEAGVNRRQPTPDPLRVAEAKHLYESGLSLTQVADQLGTSGTAIFSWLKSDGLQLRPQNGYSTDIKDEAVRLYSEGMSPAEISKRLDLGEQGWAVRDWAAKAGIGRTLSEATSLVVKNGRVVYSGINTPWQSEKTGRWEMAHSTYELLRMEQLDSDNDVVDWSKKTPLVKYTDASGKRRTYVPDFIIHYKDGRVVVEEIKPEFQLADPTVMAKLDAARAKFSSEGIEYRVLTQHDIGIDGIKENYRKLKEAKAKNKQLLDSSNDPTAPASGGVKFSRSMADTLSAAANERKTKIVGETNRQYTPAQLAAMKAVGFQVELPSMKERAQELWKDAGKKLAQGLVDQFAPIKDIDKDAYGLLRLAKGASGAFEVFMHGGLLKLEGGVYNFDNTQRGGVVDRLLKPLQTEHHDFFRWIAANRAERLKGEGKENLFSESDIASLKTLADGVTNFDYTIQNGARKGQVTRDRTAIYRDSLTTFNGFQNNVLDMAEQSGLIDGEARKMWEHEFYVPFYRIEDDGSVAGAHIKNGVVRQQAFKSLTGRGNKLNADLLDNTLMNWAHLLDASAKNRAAKATIEAIEAMGAAIPLEGSAGTGSVWFRENGQKRWALIDDPHLLTAVSALEYAGMRNPVMNAMGSFKRALTIGVTASPYFKVRNLIRDSVQAIGTGNLSYNPVKNLSEGWKLTDPKSDAYFRLMAGGGTIHFGTMMEGSESKRVQALVESGVDDSTILGDQHKVKAFYRKFIEPGITAYNEIGNRGEAINRAALYDQLVKQGVSHADASLQARDLMDFSMQGSFTTIRFLTQVVPFLNARIQGLYKLGKSAKEDPARFSAVLGATAMFSLALLAGYSDDEDWKKREDWDRNNYWWFKFGGTAFRIPKPFEIGAIATLAERGFELAFEKEMTNKRFMAQVMTLLGDNLSMNPIPQMVKPILDVYANKDSFSGRPIETMGMDRLKPEYRFTDRTSMTARGLSTAANAVTGLVGSEAPSPVQIDSMLRGYFGWLGSFVVGAGDVLARPATDQPGHAAPDYWKTATGSIVSDLRDAPSRYVSQMYTQAKEIEQVYGTWKLLQKEGKFQEAADFAKGNKDQLSKYHMIESLKRHEASANQRIRMVERSNQDADTKRELIRKIQDEKDRIARSVSP